MNWLNLQTSVLHAPEFIGSKPIARATWLAVMLWCVQQENGGRIAGARTWKTRRWQQTCGVTVAEVTGADQLLEWEGDDLVVWGYPLEKEAEVRESRAFGAKGGGSRSAAKIEAARKNGRTVSNILNSEMCASALPSTPVERASTTQGVTQAPTQAPTQGVTQRKGKEGKGKERKAAGRAREGEAFVDGGTLIADSAPPAETAGDPRAEDMAGTIPEPGSAQGAADIPPMEESRNVIGTRSMKGPQAGAYAGQPDDPGEQAERASGAAGSAPQRAGMPTLEEVLAYGASPQGNVPAEVCAVWWNDHEARPLHAQGGYMDRDGHPVRNWRASLCKFALRWRNLDEQRRQQRPPQPRTPFPAALSPYNRQTPPPVGFRVGG